MTNYINATLNEIEESGTIGELFDDSQADLGATLTCEDGTVWTLVGRYPKTGDGIWNSNTGRQEDLEDVFIRHAWGPFVLQEHEGRNT